MNTVTATFPDGAELDFDIPESWDELTRKQFEAIAPLMYGEDVINLLTRFAYLILGKDLFKQIQGEENMDELVHAFAFLCKAPVLAKSHYKGFEFFKKRFFGVDDKLLDMTIEDFGICEGCLSFWEAPESQKLFYSTIHKRGVLSFLPMSKNKRAALRLNYEAQRGNLPLMYPKLPSSSSNAAPDYHGLIIKIAGQEFGDLRHTKKALLHDVLKKLELNAIQNAKDEPANSFKI